MIRPNYYLLGGWTEEEFLHYWAGERAMERTIEKGQFKETINELVKSQQKTKN